MKLTGEITVQAPREAVFKALRDARFFASCVDGVHDLTEADGTCRAHVVWWRHDQRSDHCRT